MSDSLSRTSIKGYGWLPDTPDQRDNVFSTSYSDIKNLPSFIDLRPGCPAVYDQGHLGSCTANAISAAIQFDRLKQGLVDFTPSRLFIYYNERLMEGTVNSDSGAMIRDGIKSVNQVGACPESFWVYNIPRFTDKPSDQAYSEAFKHEAIGYERIYRDLDQMKGCLASGYPFVFGFSVYSSFESKEVANSGIVNMPANDEQLLGGHAVLAVGYMDDTQRFLVRNSWGPDWGMGGGYFTIPYEYLMDQDLSDDMWCIRIVK